MKPQTHWAIKCNEKHEPGEECQGLLIRPGTEDGELFLPYWDSETLAQLALSDLVEISGVDIQADEYPIVVKITITIE